MTLIAVFKACIAHLMLEEILVKPQKGALRLRGFTSQHTTSHRVHILLSCCCIMLAKRMASLTCDACETTASSSTSRASIACCASASSATSATYTNAYAADLTIARNQCLLG